MRARDGPPSGPRSVEVIFIRHAETEENRKVSSAVAVVKALCEIRLPEWKHLIKAISLLDLNQNSDISPRGYEQLGRMRDTLRRTGFWEKYEFDLCAYSPFTRTKITATTLIPEERMHLCLELDHLREIAPWEHLYSSELPRRIDELETWIANSNADRLLLVGHCKYFQELLSTDTFMWNCDMWRSTITFPPAGQRGVASWSEPQLLVRSPYSSPHPADSLSLWHILKHTGRKSKTKRRSFFQPAPSFDAHSEEEPICRICQASRSEMPDVPLLRPCMCSGSQAFVHQSCLNQWRATSTSAFTTCSICKYNYQLKRSLLARVITSPPFVALSLAIAFIASSLALGAAVELLSDRGIVPVSLRAGLSRMVLWSPLRPLACDMLVEAVHRNMHVGPSAIFSELYAWGLLMRCSDVWGPLVGRGLLGAATAGVVGQLAMYLLHIMHLHAQDPGQFMGALGVTFFWFNATDLDGTFRIWMLIGWYVLATTAYKVSLERLRHWAQAWFGDDILDAE